MDYKCVIKAKYMYPFNESRKLRDYVCQIIINEH